MRSRDLQSAIRILLAGVTFRFILAEFSRSVVDGRRDLVARSSSEVSEEFWSCPELLGDEEVELFDVFEDSLGGS